MANKKITLESLALMIGKGFTGVDKNFKEVDRNFKEIREEIKGCLSPRI